MRTELAIASLVALSAASCAPRDYSWTTAVHLDGKAPTRFVMRNESELWGLGGTPVRRIGGRWEKLDLCGGDKVTPEVAFDGNAIWVMCGRTLVRYDDETKANVVSYPNDGTTRMLPLARGFVLIGQSKVFGLKDGAIVPLFSITASTPDDPEPTCGVTVDDLYRAKPPNIEHWDGTAWSPVAMDNQGSNVVFCTLRGGHAYAGEWRLENGTATRIAGNDETKRRGLSIFSVVDESTSVYFGRNVDLNAEYSNGTASAADDDMPAAKAFLWSWKGGSLEYLGGAPMIFGGMYGGSSTSAMIALDPNHVFLSIGNDILEGTR